MHAHYQEVIPSWYNQVRIFQADQGEGADVDFADARLDDFPEFSAWYRQLLALAPNDRGKAPSLAKAVGATLAVWDKSARIDIWLKALTAYVEISRNIQADYRNSDAVLKGFGIDLGLIISDFASLSIHCGRGPEHLSSVIRLADASELISLRFLSAWLALNTNDLDTCISECDKVDNPYAAFYVLQGQAFLELGRAKEAAEVLGIATKLDPNEVLGFFFAAKAHCVLGDLDAAWEAAQSCHENTGSNPEIGMLMTLIATAGSAKNDRLQVAWQVLSQFLRAHEANDAVVCGLLDLSFLAQQRGWAEHVVAGANWKALFSERDFYRKVGKMLKGFGELGWLDLAASVLGQFEIESLPASG